MSLKKKSAAGGLGITCRELTLTEIRDWMKELAEARPDVDLVGDTLIEGVTVADLGRMTDATPEQLGKLAPSELRELGSDCKEVNADFFALRDRLDAHGRQILERLSEGLSETPAR